MTLLAVPAAQALAAEPLRYNVVEMQASAEREVGNDLLLATLYIQQEGADSAQVGNTVNRAIADALNTAKAYPAVKVRTGNNQTMPVYDRNNKQTGWRGRGEIRLETRDFTAGANLIGKLQSTLQLANLSFAVAPETRKKVEDELIAEAIAAFKSRAELIKGVMAGKSYKIQRINLNTGYSGPPPRPQMMAMAKSADVAPPPVEGGTSQVNVQVNGAIEVE
jgi:predicted secreted protein